MPPRTEFVTAAQGKPGLRRDEPMGFNLSHSGAHGLVGLSQQMAIGVDLEQRIDLPDVWALAEEHFSIDEQQQLKALPSDQVVTAFLRAWTRKEACLKALGCGLLLPASGLEAGLAPQPRRLWVEHEFQRHELWVESIPQPQGILAAVACVVPFGPPMSVTA